MRRTLLPMAVLLLLPALVRAAEPQVLVEDKFAGKLGEGWTWLRENPKTWRLHGGGLEICVEPGVAPTVKNALLRSAPDRSQKKYAVEVTITFTTLPTNPFEQAGITWYQDGKPAFKFVHEHVKDKDLMVPGMVPAPDKTVQLRLVVTADRYTAQFRPGARALSRRRPRGGSPPAPASRSVSSATTARPTPSTGYGSAIFESLRCRSWLRSYLRNRRARWRMPCGGSSFCCWLPPARSVCWL